MISLALMAPRHPQLADEEGFIGGDRALTTGSESLCVRSRSKEEHEPCPAVAVRRLEVAGVATGDEPWRWCSRVWTESRLSCAIDEQELARRALLRFRNTPGPLA